MRLLPAHQCNAKEHLNITCITPAILGLAIVLGLTHSAAAWTILEGLGMREPEDYLEISVSYDPDRCADPEYPLHVEFWNNYNRSVLLTRFKVFARLPDRSSEIYSTYSRNYQTDYIIHPSDGVKSCWRIPIGSIDDFCQGSCLLPGEDRDQAIAKKLEEYPPQEMVWGAEVNYVETED